MITTTAVVNEMIKVYFQADSGIVDFSGVDVYINGVQVVNPNVNIFEMNQPGLYTYTYIPTSTGKAALLFNQVMVAYLDIVSRSVYSFVKNIEDEAIGSWTWDKTLGELNLVRQDGSPLASFDVTDNQTTATRERTS